MTETLFFDVESPAALNEFLRVRLQEVFGEAATNSKVRRLLFSGNVLVCPNSRGGGFFVCKNPAFALKKNARIQVLVDKERFFYEKQNDDIKFELDELVA